MRLQSPFRIETMDNKKTAEIWMEFDQAYRNVEDKAFSSKEELLNILLWLERWTGIYKEKKEKALTWPVSITVRTPASPKPAYIRVFPKEGRQSDQIPIVRKLTEEDGTAVFEVGKGIYNVHVTCQAPYLTWEKEICLPRDAALKLDALLKPMGEEEPGWIAGDLHHHSIYSSPVYGGTDAVIETPAQVRLSMQAAGCRFGALSDHHNILNHEEWQREEKNGFCPLISKEISTSNGHIAALGAKMDVVYDIPEGKNRTDKRLKQEYVDTTGRIRSAEGIAQLNHPYDTSKSTAWPQKFGDIISIFSSIEIFNGAHPILEYNGNGKAVMWWLALLCAGQKITGTAGSDTHNTLADQFDGDLLQICGILEIMFNKKELLPKSVLAQTEILEDMGKRSLPPFLEWAGKRLGSACVRTFVRTNGENTSEKILEAILHGKCMVTDGPILYVKADGAGPGEHRREQSPFFSLQVRILTEEKPGRLNVYLEDGRLLERQIMEKDRKSAYEYVVEVPDIPVGEAAWAVCVLSSGQRLHSVTNPIYLGC